MCNRTYIKVALEYHFAVKVQNDKLKLPKKDRSLNKLKS